MTGKMTLVLGAAALAIGLASPGFVAAQKYGGTLQALLPGSPPSLSIHDESAVNTVWAMLPAYNSLVLYNPLVERESLESIIPELASSWRWSDDKNNVTFTLNKGVRFHDGKPMTSKDVKHTFDVVRGVTTVKTKLSPRKLWYFNVTDIVTNGDYEVTFKLRRPQPSLLAMLATGFAPVYPAHVHPRELRTREVGTGPFKIVDYQRDRFLKYVKNTDYFVPERPYLDGIRYNIIRKLATRMAAVAGKQVDIATPNQTTKAVMDGLKPMAPGLIFKLSTRFSFSNIHFNPKRPPFDNPKLRQVVSMSLDRAAFAKSVFRGGMVPGGMMLPPPFGAWGLPKDQLDVLPGYGDIKKNKAAARKIMASLGYSATKPLKTALTTRSSQNYVAASVWTVSELKDVWIDAEIKQVASAEWYGLVARRDFAFAMNATAAGADDPDVNFYENFGCGSQRNYSDYCNPEAQRLYDEQSQEFDLAKRKRMVLEIDRKLVTDAARVVFGFRHQYNASWPYVKNLVPHQTHYSYGRMQEVWLDK